jgi:Transmembrane Fragile-X-F protein
MQIGFAGALFLVFLVLKLTHVIAWSWWWITAPLWIGGALTGIILVFVGVFALAFGRKAKRVTRSFDRHFDRMGF